MSRRRISKARRAALFDEIATASNAANELLTALAKLADYVCHGDDPAAVDAAMDAVADAYDKIGWTRRGGVADSIWHAFKLGALHDE